MRFKEHDIEFPEWLRELEFQDDSWGNDDYARAVRTLGDGMLACVWVNYDEPARGDLGNFKYSLRLEKNEEGYSDPNQRIELGEFNDAEPAKRAILALVAAHSQDNIPDAATGARRVDPATAQLLHELARKTLELPEGSPARREAEDEFQRIGRIFLGDSQRQQFEESGVKATTPERVSDLLAQLSLAAIPLGPEDDTPASAAPH